MTQTVFYFKWYKIKGLVKQWSEWDLRENKVTCVTYTLGSPFMIIHCASTGLHSFKATLAILQTGLFFFLASYGPIVHTHSCPLINIRNKKQTKQKIHYLILTYKFYLIGKILERLFVDSQNDVSFPQQATFLRWLTWEQTFDADHAAAVWSWVQLGHIKAEAEARQALPQHHLTCVF